jgi:adenine-specific DNA-methyltransferase
VPEYRYNELLADNRLWFGTNGDGVPRIKRFLSDVKDGVTALTVWLYSEVGHNQDAQKEVKFFNSDDVFTTPKPERLIQRILQLSTQENDLVLDSFLGSGTTAAVAHKMNRRYIGIEMGEHAITHCVPRLKAIIDGEQGGVSRAVNWTGGSGFTFYDLGETVFDENGNLNPKIDFKTLASHIWFTETKTPLLNNEKTPLLGVHNDIAYYLLYNGILGDKKVDGGNVLTSKIYDSLPNFEGKKVIYGEATRLSKSKLKELNITFKQTPYDVKAR